MSGTAMRMRCQRHVVRVEAGPASRRLRDRCIFVDFFNRPLHVLSLENGWLLSHSAEGASAFVGHVRDSEQRRAQGQP